MQLAARRAMTAALDAVDASSNASSNPVLEPLAVAQLIADVTGDCTDRPRERLSRLGAQALSDAELIAVVLGTGIRDRPVLELAGDVVRAAGGVAPLSRSSPAELAQSTGVGPARAARLAAAFELGRRAVETSGRHRRPLRSAEDVHRCIAPRLAGVSQEIAFVIGVDTRNALLDVVEIARGTVVEVQIHPREVFRPLIRMAAAGGVLVHNHPSGDPAPSAHDCLLTSQLREVGRVVGIPIIDHVVIGDGSFRSIAEWMGTDF
jgi:DNA repair protein RadC